MITKLILAEFSVTKGRGGRERIRGGGGEGKGGGRGGVASRREDKERLGMITKLLLARFALKKSGYGPTNGWTDRRTNQPTDGRTNPLIEMRGRI